MGKALQVGVLEARNHLSELIKRAAAGQEIVIASRRAPKVRLAPVQPGPAAGSAAAVFAAVDHFRAAHPAMAGRSRDEVDAYLDEEPGAWA